jgi:hypothetical protein
MTVRRSIGYGRAAARDRKLLQVLQSDSCDSLAALVQLIKRTHGVQRLLGEQSRDLFLQMAYPTIFSIDEWLLFIHRPLSCWTPRAAQ